MKISYMNETFSFPIDEILKKGPDFPVPSHNKKYALSEAFYLECLSVYIFSQVLQIQTVQISITMLLLAFYTSSQHSANIRIYNSCRKLANSCCYQERCHTHRCQSCCIADKIKRNEW